MSTTFISQKTDWLSGLEKAAFDDAGRVWTGVHSKGTITRAVCVEWTELYSSPIVGTPMMGLHKEGICYDWVTHQWWCCHEAGVGSHLLAHCIADFVHVVQHRFIYPGCHVFLPYLTPAQHSGSSSASVCILSASLHCWPSLWPGGAGTANLQLPTSYQKQAAGMLVPEPLFWGDLNYVASLRCASAV